MILSAVLTGMLAFGITASTEACPPIPPRIHTINHDHHFNKVQDKNPIFVCGRDRRGRINGSIRCIKKYDRSIFVCTRTTIPPQHIHNTHH